MSRLEKLGVTEADWKEVNAIKRFLHIDSYVMPDDMPIAPSEEEMKSILNSCAHILEFEYA